MAYKNVICGVYTITHVRSGRVYVGSAINIYQRWTCHRSSLTRGVKCSPYLGQAWRKYGPDEFEFKIVEVVKDAAELVSREQHWIDKFQSYKRDRGFNIAPNARSNIGVIVPQETRAKIAAGLRGQKRSQEFRDKASAWMRGNKNGVGSNGGSRLRDEEIVVIFQEMARGELIENVAQRYNVDRATIGRIINRKTWDHIDIPPDVAKRAYDLYHGRRAKTLRGTINVLAATDVAIIKRELINGTRPIDLARQYNVTDGTIHSIKAGRTWKDITPIQPTDTRH